MRSLLITVAILIGSVAPRTACADEPARLVSLSPHEPPAALNGPGLLGSARTDRAAAHRVRAVGMGVAIGGSVLSIVGISLLSVGIVGNVDQHTWALNSLIAGSALLGVGQGALITGIPLWGVGAARANAAERTLISLSAGGLSGRF